MDYFGLHLVKGKQGTGKTVFLKELAADFKKQYPDGLLYLSGFDVSGMEIDQTTFFCHTGVVSLLDTLRESIEKRLDESIEHASVLMLWDEASKSTYSTSSESVKNTLSLVSCFGKKCSVGLFVAVQDSRFLSGLSLSGLNPTVHPVIRR